MTLTAPEGHALRQPAIAGALLEAVLPMFAVAKCRLSGRVRFTAPAPFEDCWFYSGDRLSAARADRLLEVLLALRGPLGLPALLGPAPRFSARLLRVALEEDGPQPTERTR
ncbi:MAG TPA: hypothetical protein VM364_04665 [Vicinamibacterales bacterium]|nr:hypothetical protein [Vicinamibacterales bacterium]